MENRRKLTTLSLLFLVGGVVLTGSGAALLTVSWANYNNTHGLVQYAEFWVVARSGGGLLISNISGDYTKSLPFTADPSDLRIWNLDFNISVSQPAEFAPMMQFIASLSAPNYPLFKTTWLTQLMHAMSDQATAELLARGMATPHNITVYYVEAVLSIFANNTVYTFSLGRSPYARYTDKNSTLHTGQGYMKLWELDYDPSGTFTYYVPDLNYTILRNLGFNSGGNLSFSLLVDWNVSFEQEYGPGLNYAGNVTIANWLFKKLDADTIGVSISMNNTNYYNPPVPAFTVVPWTPLPEVGVPIFGLIVIAVGFVLWRARRLSQKHSEPHVQDRE